MDLIKNVKAMKCQFCIVNLQMLPEDLVINTSFATFSPFFMSYNRILIINYKHT